MQESDGLIYRYLDRDLDEAGCARLARWVGSSPANARRFALLASEQYQVRELTRCAVVSPGADSQAEVMRSLLAMEQSAEVDPVVWHAPKPARPVRHFQSGAEPSRRRTRSRVIVIPPWVVGGSVLTAALIALLVLLQPNPKPPAVTPGPPAVAFTEASAVVESSRGVVWSSQPSWTGGSGDRLPSGRVELARGEVSIRFDGGARVVLNGPSVFEVEDGRAMRLETGRAVVASAPWEDGFTLNTSQQRIVDRDTTFGVAVFDGTTQVQVFEGAVDLYPPDLGAGGHQSAVRAVALQAYANSGDGPEPTTFEVDRFRGGISAELVPTVQRRTVMIREGADGYRGTTDTWFSGRTTPPERSGNASMPYLRIGQWGDTNQQTLIRFDSVFGPGMGQIPVGAQVERAVLVLHNPGDIRDSYGIASPQGDAFAVYPLLSSWDEADGFGSGPWSAGATPQVDMNGREASADPIADCRSWVSAAAGHIVPADARIDLDITASVVGWSRGEVNHGVLLQSIGAHPLSETSEGGDAIFIASSEYTTDPTLRPAIEVTYLVVEPAQR